MFSYSPRSLLSSASLRKRSLCSAACYLCLLMSYLNLSSFTAGMSSLIDLSKSYSRLLMGVNLGKSLTIQSYVGSQAFIIEYQMQGINKQIHCAHTFAQAGVDPFICRLLQASLYATPTPIQYHSLKLCLERPGMNLVCRSKSGTGKTLAYLTMFLQRMGQLSALQARTQAVVLVPTRELAVQVYQNVRAILDKVPELRANNPNEQETKSILSKIQVMLTIGGISFDDDRRKYRQSPAQLVVSTVGRMYQLCKNEVLRFSESPLLVMDEGDKLLGARDDKLTQVLGRLSSTGCKWVVFSATYSRDILQVVTKARHFCYLHTLLKNHELEVVITEDIEQQIKVVSELPHAEQTQQEKQCALTQNIYLQNIRRYFTQAQPKGSESLFQSKVALLKVILSDLKYQKCLVFVEKKTFLEQLSQALQPAEHVLIHGSLSQAARFRMMNRINTSNLIITSDLLARGIDIKLDLVILFDAKQTETFWHRIGRTGRYGRAGVVISLDRIADPTWAPYQVEEVNAVLQGIDVGQKKQWYGAHLTEIGKWGEVSQQNQEQAHYKYFQQGESQLMEEQPEEEGSEGEHSACLQRLSEVNSEAQLIKFIRENILCCSKCLQLMEQTSRLTGYQFDLLKYR